MRRRMRTRSEDGPDEPLDPALRAAAAAYHEPPVTVPREAIWQRIQTTRTSGGMAVSRGAGLVERRAPAVRERTWWRRTPMLAAAATVLVAVGVSLGWWMRGTRREPLTVVPPAVASASVSATRPADRIAVTRDLAQAEVLLTAFRDNSHSSDAGAEAQFGAWTREVLSNTELLLDSPVASDPQRRQLLKDLELVLVQMTQSGPSYTATDREMIDRTLERDHVLLRIRAAVPAGNAGT
jgi:hypothetical protein